MNIVARRLLQKMESEIKMVEFKEDRSHVIGTVLVLQGHARLVINVKDICWPA